MAQFPKATLSDAPESQKDTKQKEPKKEFTPKVRNTRIGHFLFEQDGDGIIQIASFPDLKSFQEGVKQRAKAVPDSDPIPNWVYFRGRFKPVGIERIRGVKVKL